MAMSAKALAKKVKEVEAANQAEAAKILRKKCVDEVTAMMNLGIYASEVDLTEEDLQVLNVVTEEMRELDYKFCLVEIQNESGVVLNHKLRVSVAHLRK